METESFSKCCNASFHVEGGTTDGSTYWWECDKCGQPTDPKAPEEKKDEWWKEMIAWPESGASEREVEAIILEERRRTLDYVLVLIAQEAKRAKDFWDKTGCGLLSKATTEELTSRINEECNPHTSMKTPEPREELCEKEKP